MPDTHLQPVTSEISVTVVEDAARLNFLPSLLGAHPHQMMRGETLVYSWLRSLCDQYTGGYWHFHRLSNGGGYLSPAAPDKFQVSCDGNGFEGELSADAAGIVVTLFALCQLAAETNDEAISNRYHQLRNFALLHAEAGKIMQAID